MTGTIGREWLYPLPGIVKALQFVGAWSYYSIETGWRSHLSAPAFVRSNETTWRSVSFAYAVDGRYAFMDNSMVWGGNVYESANAHYPLEPYGIGFGHVIFYPHPYGYVIPTDTLLWDPTTDCSSGGNGCPYVYAWDGQRFVKDNNLLAAAEVSNGADVEDYYKLEQQLAPTYQGVYFSTYSLQIREYEHEHDYFDMAKLLRVDRPPDVNVAVSPYGEILTYANPMAPTSAVDDFGNDVLSSLSTVGGDYYEGYNGSYVTVKFNATNVADGVKLVIREDGPFSPPVPKCPVDIQVQNASGHWNTVAVFHTRTYWATDIINMTGSLPDANGEFKVRLCFIANDLIDYIGLDATPQAPIEVEEATLLLAVHSSQGFVTPLLRANDQNYAELVPGQHLQLLFLLPTRQNQESNFILYSEGHYDTIS